MVVFKKEEEQNIDFRNLFKSLLKIYEVQNAKFTTYRIVGKLVGEKFGKLTFFKHLAKESLAN